MGLIAFQSTRPVRGGTFLAFQSTGNRIISIHPPRAGRDRALPGHWQGRLDFNPPAPCGAGHAGAFQSISDILFQSTRPVRGGTSYCVARYKQDAISIHPPRAGRDGEGRCAQSELKDFNPPAPCGAGPLRCCRCGYQRWISIHPPRAGRDSETRLCQIQQKEFQSTRPVRGGTHITAPPQNLNKHFNPPAPCGAGRHRSGSRPR